MGWAWLEDLENFESRDALRDYLTAHVSTQPAGFARNYAGQLCSFCNEVEEGDLLVMPRNDGRSLAIGTIAGPYVHRGAAEHNGRHARRVEWIHSSVPRAVIPEDILQSFYASMTNFRLSADGAERRLRALFKAV
jgi:restriction system protein